MPPRTPPPPGAQTQVGVDTGADSRVQSTAGAGFDLAGPTAPTGPDAYPEQEREPRDRGAPVGTAAGAANAKGPGAS